MEEQSACLAKTVLNRSERTVRRRAVSVYRKSGLAGRADLSAFFLEDLLLPMRNLPTTLRHLGSEFSEHLLAVPLRFAAG